MTPCIPANISPQGLIYDGRGSSTESQKGKVKHLLWACNSTPEGPRSMESCRMHAASEHRTRPWSIGSHRTKSWAYYKAGLWQETAQPSSHTQGSGPGKDPGTGTQTQAAHYWRTAQVPASLCSLHRSLETLARTRGRGGGSNGQTRGLKGQCTLGKSCISTGDMPHRRAGRKQKSFWSRGQMAQR